MRKEIYKNWNRVSRVKAKKAFESGQTILIAPVNANMDYMFQLWCDVNKSRGWDSFEQMENNFRWYNCNRELGMYPKYFIEEV